MGRSTCRVWGWRSILFLQWALVTPGFSYNYPLNGHFVFLCNKLSSVYNKMLWKPGGGGGRERRSRGRGREGREKRGRGGSEVKEPVGWPGTRWAGLRACETTTVCKQKAWGAGATSVHRLSPESQEEHSPLVMSWELCKLGKATALLWAVFLLL